MAATNRALLQYDGTNWGVNSRGERIPIATRESWAAEEADRMKRYQDSMAGHNRLVNFGRIASVAPLGLMFAPGGALAAGGGSAAAPAAGWSMPGVSAPTFGTAAGPATAGAGAIAGGATATAGKLATLGKIFSSPGLELGVNALTSVLGTRSANKGADKALAAQMAANREALALERQRLETEARNADLDREDARALNAAINELKKRELDAAEEERAFNRGLVESREARLAPYRGMSEAAMRKLASMWGI